MNSNQLTSHQLAQLLLAGEDLPVAVGRDLGLYSLHSTEFRVAPNGSLLFNGDKVRPGEEKKKIVWITGSPLL